MTKGELEIDPVLELEYLSVSRPHTQESSLAVWYSMLDYMSMEAYE